MRFLPRGRFWYRVFVVEALVGDLLLRAHPAAYAFVAGSCAYAAMRLVSLLEWRVKLLDEGAVHNL